MDVRRLLPSLVAYGGLLVATAVAAYLLVDINLLTWTIINYDPQGFDQQWLAYETAGAFGYTSGAIVGQTSALAAGLLVASRSAAVPRLGLVAAGVAGVGLWLSAFAVALGSVRSRLPKADALGGMVDRLDPFDPELLHDRTVIAIIVLNLAGYLFAALLGYGLGSGSRDRLAVPDLVLPRGVRFVAWGCYALLVGFGLLAGLGYLVGVFTAETVPRFLVAMAVYGFVIAACVFLARPGNLQVLAPLPLLLAGPFSAMMILASGPPNGNSPQWGLLAPAVVAAVATWAAVACWPVIRLARRSSIHSGR